VRVLYQCWARDQLVDVAIAVGREAAGWIARFFIPLTTGLAKR
jgi:hypothetical protein